MSFHKRINRFLAEWVSAINALAAVGIPAGAALLNGAINSGDALGRFSFIAFVGGFLGGGVLGILLAGPLCGVLAVLIDIRNALTSPGRRTAPEE